MGQILRGQVVAEPVALLHEGPQFGGLRVEGERRRVAYARGERRLVGAVGIEALDRRLGLGLDPEIARRADADIEPASLRVDRQMAVLVALNEAEDTLLGQQSRTVGAG